LRYISIPKLARLDLIEKNEKNNWKVVDPELAQAVPEQEHVTEWASVKS
jgi:hypothetical protein